MLRDGPLANQALNPDADRASDPAADQRQLGMMKALALQQPQKLLHLAGYTPGLDWESDVPETISYQLYLHARSLHRARFAPVLEDIRLWPADTIHEYQGSSVDNVAEGYVRDLLNSINTMHRVNKLRVMLCIVENHSWATIWIPL